MSLSSLCYELFMRQLSHCSHRHVNSTFWSLTEDFINEYGSKFLDNKSFIVDWLINKENINARTYIPSGMVCDRANQEAWEFDSHSGSVFNSVENAHYFPFYIRYKFRELPVHVRAYTLMQVRFL